MTAGYAAPSMEEVRAASGTAGLRAATTFAGCGGSSIGMRLAGFDVCWANEFEPAAADTYEHNFPGVPVDRRDVREVQPEEVLEATGLDVGELDLLDGSPPCQSFSTSGKRHRGWGKVERHADGTHQRSDDLFFEYVRLLRGIQPRAFVAENVAGMVKGTSKGVFKRVLEELRASGYRVGARVIDAQWLGVPQRRQRVIFVGAREDLRVEPAFPTPARRSFSVVDACPWLAHPESTLWYDTAGVFGGQGKIGLDRPVNTLVSGASHFHVVEGPHPDLGVDDVDREVVPVTRKLRTRWEGLRPGSSDDKAFNLVRSHPDRPAPALLASWQHGGTNQALPPFAPRKFTILEAKRLFSFPDDFELLGRYQQRWARLGNSVPPLMARAVAEAVRDRVLLGAGHDARGPTV